MPPPSCVPGVVSASISASRELPAEGRTHAQVIPQQSKHSYTGLPVTCRTKLTLMCNAGSNPISFRGRDLQASHPLCVATPEIVGLAQHCLEQRYEGQAASRLHRSLLAAMLSEWLGEVLCELLNCGVSAWLSAALNEDR